MGLQISANAYHVPIIRNDLTKNLGLMMPDIHDEIVHAFSEIIPATDGRDLPHTAYRLECSLCLQIGPP